MVARQARIDDTDRIINMYEELYAHLTDSGFSYDPDIEHIRNSLPSQIQSKLYLILVAEQDGETIGFLSACLHRADRKFKSSLIGVVNDIFVYPGQRGKSAGAMLVREAESWMCENGAQSVQCNVVAGNSSALTFWRNHGYADAVIITSKSLKD